MSGMARADLIYSENVYLIIQIQPFDGSNIHKQNGNKIRKRQIQTWPSLSVNGQNPTGQNPTRQNPIEQNPTQIKTHFKNTMWLVMISKFIKLYLISIFVI